MKLNKVSTLVYDRFVSCIPGDGSSDTSTPEPTPEPTPTPKCRCGVGINGLSSTSNVCDY